MYECDVPALEMVVCAQCGEGLFALKPPRQRSRQAEIVNPGGDNRTPGRSSCAPGNFAKPQSKRALNAGEKLMPTSEITDVARQM